MKNEVLDGRTVLITGGSGFLGRNLVAHFLEEGYRVTSVDVSPRADAERREIALEEGEFSRAYPGRIDFQCADVTDEVALGRVFATARPWLVIHAAALTALERDDERSRFGRLFGVNVAGTATALEAARQAGAERFIHLSSGTAYGSGPPDIPLREDAQLQPTSVYGMSKHMSELVCRRYHALWDGQLEMRIVRVSSPYGEWERVRASRPLPSDICHWSVQAVRDLPVRLSFDGARDFTYVGDTVDGIARVALARETRHDTYNVACGRQVRYSEVLGEIQKLRPGFAFAFETDAGAGADGRSTMGRGPLSIERIRGELGFEPKTPLSQGLRRYLDWLEKDRVSLGPLRSGSLP